MSETQNQMKLQEIQLDKNNEEIRFLYVTDSHFNATSPKRRKDDITDTSLEKFAEVGVIAEEREADFILHGGDFFEKPDVTDLYAGRVARVIRKFKQPVYVVPGGHDLFGNNIESVARTKLGFFERSGLVNLLTHPKNECVIIRNGSLSVQLTGTGSHFGIDVDDIEEDFVIKEKQADFAVHMIHGMLMPTPFLPNTPTVVIDQIKHTLADITLAGHFHLGFDPVQEDGKWYVNCGAMIRKKADIKELDRMPQVALITISKANGVQVELIPLTAKPGNEVLDRSQIEQAQQQKQQRQNFMGQMQQSKMVKSLNVNTIVKDLAQNKALPPLAIKTALEAVERMQERLESDKVIPLKGDDGKWKFITKIILHNFKSYDHAEINLSEGINVIVGESDKGKTVIIRGIKWVLYNEIKGSICRYGTTDTYVTLFLSDGTKITRGRRKIKNYYTIQYADGRPEFKAENFRDTIPTEVIEATGVMKVQIDMDKELALNINGQLEGPFLLSETGTVKAKAIGSIVKTNVLDAAERDIQKELTSGNAELKELEAQIAATEKELEQFKDIDKEEAAIKRMETLIARLIAINAKAEKLAYLHGKIEGIEKEIENTEALLFDLMELPKLEILFMRLKEIYRNQRQVATLKTKLDQRDTEIAEIQDVLKKLATFPQFEKQVIQLEAVQARHKALAPKKATMDNIDQEIGRQKITLDQLKVIPQLEDKCNRLEQVHDKSKKVRTLYDSVAGMNREVAVQEAVIKRLAKLPDMEASVRRLEDLHKKSRKIADKKIAIDSINQEMAKEKIMQDKLQTLPQYEAQVIKLDALQRAINKLIPIRMKLAENENNQKAGKEYINKTARSIDQAVDSYIEALKQRGKCPTCTHDITDKELKKIAHELKGAM